MLRANSVSPAISNFSAGKYRQTLPSVWPGVWRTFAVRLPACSESPSAMLASIVNFAWRGHAEPRSLHVEHLQQRVVILIEQDRRAGQRAQLHRSADVIDVGVGDDDLLHLQFMLADDGENVFNVVARIDDHGFMRGLIADDRAVALQRADGKDLMYHSVPFSLGACEIFKSMAIELGVSRENHCRVDSV